MKFFCSRQIVVRLVGVSLKAFRQFVSCAKPRIAVRVFSAMVGNDYVTSKICQWSCCCIDSFIWCINRKHFLVRDWVNESIWVTCISVSRAPGSWCKTSENSAMFSWFYECKCVFYTVTVTMEVLTGWSVSRCPINQLHLFTL